MEETGMTHLAPLFDARGGVCDNQVGRMFTPLRNSGRRWSTKELNSWVHCTSAPTIISQMESQLPPGYSVEHTTQGQTGWNGKPEVVHYYRLVVESEQLEMAYG
jgi:hypothetical protein